MQNKIEKAAFGAGCFWGVEEEFRKLKRVISTTVGYMGGNMKNPSYEDVCTNKTGHVEVVMLEYNPKNISYSELLETFWKIHDPTQLNRQGFDIGAQYKSIIFYYTNEQKEEAMKSKEILEKSKKFKSKIVTEIVKASEFYKAEEYHQKYLMKKGLNVC
ncbi:peptide-methionine (S)-S-oxide reductase MsrA [Candidatus Woesearchaeota archaeon]|nr:peptide-methionine (S)-S-oxide reductase MsrA [Candidatus Woesearchaeota archaeon]